MELFIGAVVSGVIVGLTFAMIGFSAAILYRSNGVLSFAQPMIATLLAFVGHFLVSGAGLNVWETTGVMLLAAGPGGAALYFLVFRVNEKFGNLNAVMRTIALFLLIQQVIVSWWSAGEPFPFPGMAQGASLSLPLGAHVTRQGLVILAAMALLLVGALVFFTATRTGLLFRSLAESPENAMIIGVPTKRLSALSWALATVICAVVAAVNAPVALVSTDMFSPYVLLAFTALLVGGLNSWSGAVVGGVLVGLVNSVLVAYTNTEMATLAVFALLLVTLIVRPGGLVGSAATAERF